MVSFGTATSHGKSTRWRRRAALSVYEIVIALIVKARIRGFPIARKTRVRFSLRWEWPALDLSKTKQFCPRRPWRADCSLHYSRKLPWEERNE